MDDQKNISKGVLSSLVNIVLSWYSVLSELNLLVNSYLLYLNFEENIGLMIISVAICLAQTLLFGNFCNKKEQNYQTSQISSLVLKLLTVTSLIIIPFTIRYEKLQYFLVSSLLIGFSLLAWYLKVGYQLYYKSMALKIQLSVLISLNLQFFLLEMGSIDAFSLVEWIFTLIVTFLFLIDYEKAARQMSTKYQQTSSFQNIKLWQLKLDDLLKQSDKSIEKQALLIGYISDHSKNECQNRKCWTNSKQKEYFSPQTQSNENNIIQNKVLLTKHLIKCLYQKALLKNREDTKTIINYCQFMIAEFGGSYQTNQSLHKLFYNTDVGLLQRLKIIKLNLLMKRHHEILNKQTSGGNLDLTTVLCLQESFQAIRVKIRQYNAENMQIWQNIRTDNIDLLKITSTIEQNLVQLQKIEKQWAKLSKYFQYSRQWKLTYLNYKFLIKNQQISQRQLEFLSQTPKKQQSVNLNQIGQTSNFQKLCFDKQSAIVIAEIYQNQLIIKNVSQNFEHLTHYNQEEIKRHPVTLLMPSAHIDTHSQNLSNWVTRENLTKMYNCEPITTKLIKKDNIQVDCQVFFKVYIDLLNQEGNLKLFCLIRQTTENHQQHLTHNENLDQMKSKRQQFVLRKQHIFLKEDIDSGKENTSIYKAKASTRLFCIVIILIALILPFKFQVKVAAMQQKYSLQQFFMKSYRNPLGLIKNYIKLFLNIGSRASVQAQTKAFTTDLLNIVTDQKTIRILSDQTINQPARYAPFQVNSANKGIIYDQIDIYYVVYSCITSLSNSKEINRRGNDFVNLDSYLKPSFDTMMNKTKYRLHNALRDLMVELQQQQQMVILSVGFFFFIISCYFYYQTSKFRKDMNSVYGTIVNFDRQQIAKILAFWRKVQRSFQFLGFQEELVSQISHIVQSNQKNDDFKAKKHSKISTETPFTKAILNKTKKTINSHQKGKKRAVFATIVFPFFTFLLVMIPETASIIKIIKIEKLLVFQNHGFDLIKFMPITSTLGYALTARYYNQLYPNQTSFLNNKFQDTLSTLYLIGQYSYENNAELDSLFYIKRKNYLFGNPCVYNQTILAAASNTFSNCMSYYNQSITNGIISYFRTIYPITTEYLNGKRNLSLAEVSNLTASLTIATYYLLDITDQWFMQFEEMLNQLKKDNVIQRASTTLAFLLLYFIVLQILVLPKLKRQFEKMKLVFKTMVPQSILAQEQSMRYAFGRMGIIGLS